MFRGVIKYGFFPLVALVSIAVVALKLMALFVFSGWDRWVSVGLLLFSVLAISKLLMKSIRLRIAEHVHQRRGELHILPPLGRGAAFSWRSMILVGVLLPLVVFSGLGIGAYTIRQRVQASAALDCIGKQPAPLAIPNNVPTISYSLNTTKQPNMWHYAGLGTNDALFAYIDKGYQGNHTVSITIHHYKDGSAFWLSPSISVQAGNTYQYDDWYQASGKSALIVQYVTNGVVHYQTIDNNIPATQKWRHYSRSFDMPSVDDANTLSVSLLHALTAAGTLNVNRVVMHPELETFMRPLISFTFDDGWKSQYTNGLPLLCKYKIPSTFYLVSDYLQGYPDYMNINQASDLVKKREEIGGHTVDHKDLAKLYPDAVKWELTLSQERLQKQFAQNIDDFASPYGSTTDSVVAQIRHYYASHRSTDEGLNDIEDFDPYDIQCITYTKGTTLASMEKLVNQAIQTKAWLVFAFHQIDDSSSPYAAKPAFFEQLLQYVANHKSILPLTMHQALTEVRQQTGQFT